MQGYNDDLVMSFAIALWIRDTALRLSTERNDLQRSMMDSMVSLNGGFTDAVMTNTQPKNNPYKMKVGKDEEDLTWLLG